MRKGASSLCSYNLITFTLSLDKKFLEIDFMIKTNDKNPIRFDLPFLPYYFITYVTYFTAS